MNYVWAQEEFYPVLPDVKHREGENLMALYWYPGNNNGEIEFNEKTIYNYSTNESNNRVVTSTIFPCINFGNCNFDAYIDEETFDENNNLILIKNLSVIGTDTTFSSLRTYTYDSNNKRTEYINMNEDGVIREASKYSNTYDDRNNLIERKRYAYNNQSYLSYASSLRTYSYRADNKIEEVVIQLYHSSKKIMWNDSKYVFTYDSNNNITEISRYTWDYFNGTAWDFAWIMKYSYDSNNNIIKHIPNGSTGWIYIYDSNNRLIEKKNENGITGEKFNYNSLMTIREHYRYDKITNRYEYYFKSKLSIDSEIITPSIFNITQPYPNPFNPRVSFNIFIPENNVVLINIFDVNGRLIDEISNAILDRGIHRFTWDALGRTSGIYFVQAVYNGEVQNQKIILVK